MNARILFAFLCLGLLGTGCIIHNDDDPDCCTPKPYQPGDVTFDWTFAGGRCSDVPDVKGVIITIPGEPLHNDGFFPCQTNGFAGIVLQDFVPGTYSFTIQALSYDDQLLFVGSGTFQVNGDVRVAIDLTPTGQATSYAYVAWRFPPNTLSPNPNCAQAGVAWVDVSLNGGDWVRLSCQEGMTATGVRTPYLAAGRHSLELVAVGSNGQPYYHAYGNLDTVTGQPRAYTYNFWAVGGAAVKWQLTDGSYARTCAQAGVTQVSINFVNTQTGEHVYGPLGDVHGCNDAPIVYSFLRPGQYAVYIQGTGPSGVVYLSNDSTPPLITVQAFQQVPPDQAISVQLFRAQ